MITSKQPFSMSLMKLFWKSLLSKSCSDPPTKMSISSKARPKPLSSHILPNTLLMEAFLSKPEKK